MGPQGPRRHAASHETSLRKATRPQRTPETAWSRTPTDTPRDPQEVLKVKQECLFAAVLGQL